MRVSMKLYSKIMRVAVFFGFVVACCCAGSNGVFADSYVGPGGGTGGQQTDCEYLGGYQKLCDGGANGGGASWHLYKTNEIKCEGGSNCRIPGLTSNEVKSKNGTYIYDGSVKIDDIYSNCVVDRGGSMFVAYGWEGNNSYKNTNWDGNKGKFIDKVDGTTRDGSGNGLDWLLGPAAYGIGTIGGAQYNNYENKTISEGDLRNGNINESNIRLSLDSAQMIYQSVTGDTGGIPAGTGYFCAGSPRYFAVSNVSNGVDWGSTDLAYSDDGGIPKTKYIPTRTINKGETITLTFSHVLYSVFYEKDPVAWSTVSGDWGGNGVSGANYVTYSGDDTSFTVGPVSAYGKTVYRPQQWPVYDGTDGYVARHEYPLTFNDTGTYTFCDGLKLGNKQLTEVCAEIEVIGDTGDNPPSSNNDCLNADRWVTAAKGKGWESNKSGGWGSNKSGKYGIYTVSGVINETISGSQSFDKWAIDNAAEKWTTDNQKGSNNLYSLTDGHVYAKPGDKLSWYHCYYSNVEAGRNETTNTTGYRNGGSAFDSCPTEKKLGDATENFKDGFKVEGKTYPFYFEKNTGFNNVGNGEVVIPYQSRSFTVSNDMVLKEPQTRWMESTGSKLVEISSSSDCGCHKEEGRTVCESKYTPFKETMEHEKSTAMVKVPYNFKIGEVILSLANEGDVVYAGESVKINTSLTVGPRNNITTASKGEGYTTAVKNASVAVIAYTSSTNDLNTEEQSLDNGNLCEAFTGWINCDYDDETKTLNESGENIKTESGVFSDYINVMDDDAGKWFCAALAVFPAEPYGDTDVNDGDGNPPWESMSGNYKWNISKPACKQIAKKPSVQIWGGSLYTNGKIALNNADKRVLAGFDYELKSKNSGTTTFGSWVESGIMANGFINGLASGAATGYYNPNNGERTPHYNVGGTYSSNSNPSSKVCVLGPLTMPNYSCVNSTLSNFYPGGGGNESFKHGDRESLVSVFRNNGTSVSNKFNYEKIESSGDVSLKGFLNEKGIVSGTIPKSNEQNKAQTWILEVTGSDGKYKTLTIDEDVKYEDGGYTSLSEIPKLIIYAGNINILCGVTRVDAVLITAEGGRIDTCSDAEEGNWNVGERSNQLKINGTIIADKLIAGRTYGAGTGSASAVPAEIIDYDTSLYLWAMQNAKGSNSGKMDVVYLTELAPRY